jgi:hypothetical protein
VEDPKNLTPFDRLRATPSPSPCKGEGNKKKNLAPLLLARRRGWGMWCIFFACSISFDAEEQIAQSLFVGTYYLYF